MNADFQSLHFQDPPAPAAPPVQSAPPPPPPPPPAAAPASPPAVPTTAPGGRVIASPLAKKLANEKGVALSVSIKPVKLMLQTWKNPFSINFGEEPFYWISSYITLN